jgi:nucleoporin NUP159
MRKEEVIRFSKAKDDAEYAKILKTRSLGPEHLETQIQLRRGVRVRVVSC